MADDPANRDADRAGPEEAGTAPSEVAGEQPVREEHAPIEEPVQPAPHASEEPAEPETIPESETSEPPPPQAPVFDEPYDEPLPPELDPAEQYLLRLQPREARAPKPMSAGTRTALLGLAFVVPCAVIALGLYFIIKGGAPRTSPQPAESASVAAPQASDAADAAAAAIVDAPPTMLKAAPADSAFGDETDDGEPAEPPKKAPPKPKHYATVAQAAAESCSTASVDGLSRQIIEQARCIKPNAFVPLPSRPNLVLKEHVFPYLELEARNHLVKALDAHTSGKMTVNSVLRTVAQQYLVWRWSSNKRCGVQLATPPGESNHEIGVALDIAEAGTWRPALEAQDFKWLGTSDRVHFDYKGNEGPPRTATDVLAFQTLWNRNHPTDKIATTGKYSPETEQRLKKAPPDGFALGATCKPASKH